MKQIMQPLLNVMSLIAQVMLYAMMLLITADVASRLLGIVMEGVVEVTTHYLMVAVIFLPLAAVAWHDEHIRADLFTQFLPDRGRLILEAITLLVLSATLLLLTWQSILSAMDSTRSGELIQITRTVVPIWPARWLLPFGFALGALGAVVQALLVFIELAGPTSTQTADEE